MKILVIDDDDAVRKFITEILRQDGYSVTGAENGKIALQVLAQQPDIMFVITDIIMPEQEGIETIREIKACYPRIKIIAISGGGKISPENYLQLAHAMGANTTLSKPFSRKELLDTLLYI